MDKGSTGYFWCIFAIILCLNLPFIVCDFVFAGRPDACVTTQGTNIAMNVGTWLNVDGAFRCTMAGFFMILAILGSCNIESAMKFLFCIICYMLIYGLFNFCWLIVGAVLFWGDINQQGLCNGTEAQGYMFAVLILGFIGCCANTFSSYKQRQGQE